MRYDTPVGRYYEVTHLGRVYMYPSVTTITGPVPKPYLKPWVAKETSSYWLDAMHEWMVSGEPMTEERLQAIYTAAKKAYLVKSQFAMDRGSEIHALVEHYLKGQSFVPNREYISEDYETKLYRGLKKWIDQSKFRVLSSPTGKPAVELEVHSHEHRYAGTLDVMGVAEIDDEDHTVILDFKTGKNVSDEAKLQLSAYWNAVKEMDEISINHIDQAFVVHILPSGRFSPKYNMDTLMLANEFKNFNHLRLFFPWYSKENKNTDSPELYGQWKVRAFA